METEKLPRKTEWRVKPKDRSKRVAPGCEIDPKNIISGTRKRKDFNYKLHADNYTAFEENEEEETDVKMVENYVFPILERKPRKSYNTIENRVERYDPHDPDSVKQLTDKMKKMRLRKKKENSEESVLKEKKVNRKKKESTKKENTKKDSKEEKKVEKKQPVKENKTDVVEKKEVVQKKVEKVEGGMSKENFTKLTELGAKYLKRSERTYKNVKIPTAIQEFLDHKFPDTVVLNNETLKLSNMKFTGEYLLQPEEMNEYNFLRDNKDAILIGEGDNILVSLLGDKAHDFKIFALDDEQPEKFSGPFKLSEILKDATIGEEPEEEGDMEE